MRLYRATCHVKVLSVVSGLPGMPVLCLLCVQCCHAAPCCNRNFPTLASCRVPQALCAAIIPASYAGWWTGAHNACACLTRLLAVYCLLPVDL